MKIAIIGSHGTFKTTLIYFLAGVLKAKGKNVGIVGEVARNCPYFKKEHGNVLAQNWILLTQAQLEREAQDKYDYVLCDRSLVDNFIYALEAYDKEDKEIPDWLEPFVLHNTSSYNFLFKTVIPSDKIVNDGVRSTDEDWQIKIDSRLKKYLRINGIDNVELPLSNPDESETIIEYATRQAKFMANKIIDMDVQTRL
jgi:nicotinamide riboside kinase